jgi:hypothetical protein
MKPFAVIAKRLVAHLDGEPGECFGLCRSGGARAEKERGDTPAAKPAG